jgi:predicted component of type VI protein secretion system
MKQRVRCTLFIGILVLSIVGCSKGVQDKPLPMSQEKLEKFALELEKAVKSIAPSPSQDGAELLVGAYKMVLEKKMGYSFDKTLRSVMLFYPGGAPWQLMNPVIGYVHSDPKKALDKGFISQRTFDILDTGSKAKAELTKEGDEFLRFVAECQSKNGGVCDPKLLLNVLAEHNALPAVESSSEEPGFVKLLMIESQLEGKYDIFHMGIYKWITKPDGQDIT